jgi:aryl-alcohol dehydrogenase-like predicted oxidoreductase
VEVGDDRSGVSMMKEHSDRYGDMQYRRCGRSGLKLPAISLGLWQNFGGDTPPDRQAAIVRRAFDLGIPHFDLANNYGPPAGSAEENFGHILAADLAGHRDELIISTKAGYDMWPGPYGEWGSRKYLLASLDQSLKRMGLEYLAKVRGLNDIAKRRGQTLAQMAIAWTLRNPVVTAALVGASSTAQLEQNVASLDKLDFSDQELAEIDRYATESGINLWAASSAG